jgi:hypothetical protein
MTDAARVFVGILRDAWGAMAGLLAALMVLGALYQGLRAVGGTIAGYAVPVSKALGALAGLLCIGLYGFIAVPEIARAGVAELGSVGACGPVAELGQAAALMIGGIAALRMLRAVFVAVVASIVDSGGGLGSAVVEATEALIGMALVSVASPVASAFFTAGRC